MDTPDPTTVARNAGLQNLAKYLVAVNSENIAEGDPRTLFGTAQQLATLILLDALNEYQFTTRPDEPTKPPPRKRPAPDAG